MLFTKTGAEKVNVSMPQGVRSAQCSPHFDVLHEKVPGTPNLNISQVIRFKVFNCKCENQAISHDYIFTYQFA